MVWVASSSRFSWHLEFGFLYKSFCIYNIKFRNPKALLHQNLQFSLWSHWFLNVFTVADFESIPLHSGVSESQKVSVIGWKKLIWGKMFVDISTKLWWYLFLEIIMDGGWKILIYSTLRNPIRKVAWNCLQITKRDILSRGCGLLHLRNEAFSQCYVMKTLVYQPEVVWCFCVKISANPTCNYCGTVVPQ